MPITVKCFLRHYGTLPATNTQCLEPGSELQIPCPTSPCLAPTGTSSLAQSQALRDMTLLVTVLFQRKPKETSLGGTLKQWPTAILQTMLLYSEQEALTWALLRTISNFKSVSEKPFWPLNVLLLKDFFIFLRSSCIVTGGNCVCSCEVFKNTRTRL